MRGKAMNLKNTYATIIEAYPEFINQKQVSEICGFTPKTARNAQNQGLIKGTVKHDPSNPLLREYSIRLMDVLAFLYRRECREEPESPFILGMRQYYEEKFKTYPDLLDVKNIEEMTGFQSAAITNWINKHGLFAFKRGKMFLIPKASLLDFIILPYYRRIKNKSQIQKSHILEYEKIFDGGAK